MDYEALHREAIRVQGIINGLTPDEQARIGVVLQKLKDDMLAVAIEGLNGIT
jgi:hypothetical protein